MQDRFVVPLPTSGPRQCAVCAEPVDWRWPLISRKGDVSPSPQLYPVCREAACRWLFNELGGLPEAEFKRQIEWRGQAWREERMRVGRQRERAQDEAGEASAMFAVLGRAGLPALPDLQLVVPSGHTPLRPVSERRRRVYAAHVDAVIAAALAPAEAEAPGHTVPDSETIAPDSTLPGRLCGVCGGGCCASGGTHAYLKEATVRRVLAENPGLDPASLRALYLDHVPARSVSRSCINHTRSGCTLPRSLRSDICNRWVCHPLTALLTALQADPPVRTAVVLRRRQNQWNKERLTLNNDIVAAAAISETSSRALKPPPLGPAEVPRVTTAR
jgi:hypothetical protein